MPESIFVCAKSSDIGESCVGETFKTRLVWRAAHVIVRNMSREGLSHFPCVAILRNSAIRAVWGFSPLRPDCPTKMSPGTVASPQCDADSSWRRREKVAPRTSRTMQTPSSQFRDKRLVPFPPYLTNGTARHLVSFPWLE